MLTKEQRIFLVEHVFREGDKYNEAVKERFRKEFPNTPLPYRDSVRDLISRFKQHGSVCDMPRSGRPRKLDTGLKKAKSSEKTKRNSNDSVASNETQAVSEAASSNSLSTTPTEAIDNISVLATVNSDHDYEAIAPSVPPTECNDHVEMQNEQLESDDSPACMIPVHAKPDTDEHSPPDTSDIPSHNSTATSQPQTAFELLTTLAQLATERIHLGHPSSMPVGQSK